MTCVCIHPRPRQVLNTPTNNLSILAPTYAPAQGVPQLNLQKLLPSGSSLPWRNPRGEPDRWSEGLEAERGGFRLPARSEVRVAVAPLPN
eukprot:COSAG06_NODE_2571_length_6643_cov_3.735789_7_plen_90_part_00